MTTNAPLIDNDRVTITNEFVLTLDGHKYTFKTGGFFAVDVSGPIVSLFLGITINIFLSLLKPLTFVRLFA